MTTPVLPMVDELMQGQSQRWLAWNGLAPKCAVAGRSRDKDQGAYRPRPTVQMMAAASNMSTMRYAALHTLMPFTAFLAGGGIASEGGGGWSHSTFRHHGTHLPRQQIYLCPCCVEEDVAYWGHAYWRRSHQLPGAYWCDKHPQQRLHGTPAAAAFTAGPKQSLGRRLASPHTLSESVRLNEHAQRFAEVCQSILEAGRSIPGLLVRRVLDGRARELGIRTPRTSRSRLLSDLVQRRYPRAFVEAVIPAITRKVEGERFHLIDGALGTGQQGTLPIGTAFALATLYPTATAALAALFSASSSHQGSVGRASSASTRVLVNR